MNTFRNWTQMDIEQHNARVSGSRETASEHATERESDLHSEIIEHCKRMGWIALHGSMARRTARTEGEFDFVILADMSRVFFIECKTRTGKLSPAQSALHHWARGMGHEPQIVRSMVEFLGVVKDLRNK